MLKPQKHCEENYIHDFSGASHVFQPETKYKTCSQSGSSTNTVFLGKEYFVHKS